MTTRRPLVVNNGMPANMPAGDTLPSDVLPLNAALPGLAGVTVPNGATSDREASPSAGRFRYNTTLGCFEGFTPDGWVKMSNIVLAAYRGSVGVLSGTSRIPLDNTTPLVTEGTQLWSKQVTPTVVGSVMSIDFAVMADNSSTSQAVTMSLYRDNTLIGVVSSAPSGINGNKPINLKISVNDTVTSLTPVTYQCRIGNESTGTWYVGRGSAATFNNVNQAGWKIDEVLP